MLTSVPSRETWMWPWSVGSEPLTVVWVAGTTLPPMTLTRSVTAGPVTWLGVGCVIWIFTGVAGCCAVVDFEGVAPPHPVAVTAMASTAGRARRAIVAGMVDTFFHGRNSTTANAPETRIVLTAPPVEQWPTGA